MEVDVNRVLQARLNTIPRPSCVRITIGLAIVGVIGLCIFMVVMGPWIGAQFQPSNYNSPFFRWIGPTVLLMLAAVMLFVPVTLSILAAILTLRHLSRSEFDLLKLTPIKDMQIAANLWRWVGRHSIGMLALHGLVMGGMGLLIFTSVAGTRAVGSWQYYNAAPEPAGAAFGVQGLNDYDNATSGLMTGISILGMTASNWGWVFVGVAWGVALSIWWRSWAALVVAPIMTGGTWLLMAVVTLDLIPVPNGTLWDVVAVPLMLLTWTLPLLFTYGLLRFGARFVRQ